MTGTPMLVLMTPAELPAIDGYMERTGTSGYLLMERAGSAIAEAAVALAPEARRIVVVAGPTNNGGDSLCAARFLRAAGRDVVAALFVDPAELEGDPARAAAAWNGTLARATAGTIAGADLIVDGLYGGGLAHELTGEAAVIVDSINGSGCPVLAVDFPSGIEGSSGAVLGTAVRADHTITFFCLKPGHLLMPGRMHCGTVAVDAIGIPPTALDGIQPRTFDNRPALWLEALLGSHGGGPEVVVINGSEAGAVRLGNVSTDTCVTVAVDSAADTEAVGAALETAGRRRGPTILIIPAAASPRWLPADSRSKLDGTRAMADRLGSFVVILGADPVVAEPGGRVAIAGNPAPGSNLGCSSIPVADLISSLVAEGVATFEACAAAAWAFGEASNGDASTGLAEHLPKKTAQARTRD